MTAPNWADLRPTGAGTAVRQRLGIPADALVFGIVGSLNWSRRYAYCYGLELVRAASAVERRDLRVLIVGDGSGRERLQALAGPHLGDTILLPGAVPAAEVADYLDAMDVASLPQSVDGVGAFRYTTKISEYLAAGLPIVTGEIPLSYDLDDGSIWRLPGDAPWDEQYISALGELMASVDRQEVAARRPGDSHARLFDQQRQREQASQFVLDVIERDRSGGRFRRRQQRREAAKTGHADIRA
jgi:glycosyltransferase involved in cell wall biosynthesis